jgi:hypothetical protein
MNCDLFHFSARPRARIEITRLGDACVWAEFGSENLWSLEVKQCTQKNYDEPSWLKQNPICSPIPQIDPPKRFVKKSSECGFTKDHKSVASSHRSIVCLLRAMDVPLQ